MAEWASVLVGRRDELAALERALAAVGDGAACSVALRGEPGIGKSRLLAELAGRARERGLLVLEGRAAELERDLTFALLEDALEPLVREGGAGAGRSGELEGWQLRELAAVLPAVGLEPRRRRASVTESRGRCARCWSAWRLSARWRCCSMTCTGPIRRRPTCWRCCCSGRRGRACCWRWRRGPGGRRGSSRRWRRRSSAGRRRCSSWARCRSRSWASCFPVSGRRRASGCIGRAAATRSTCRSCCEAAARLRRARAGRGRRGCRGRCRRRWRVRSRRCRRRGGGCWRARRWSATRSSPRWRAWRPRWRRRRRWLPWTSCWRRIWCGRRASRGGFAFAIRWCAGRCTRERGAAGGWARTRARPRRWRRAVRRRGSARIMSSAPRGWAIWPRWSCWRRRPRRSPVPRPRRRRAGTRRRCGCCPRPPSTIRAGWRCWVPRRGRWCRPGGRLTRAPSLRRVLAVLPAGATAERVEATVALAGLLAVWTQQPDEARRLLEAERAALGELAPGPRAALDLAVAELYAEYGDHAASETLADRGLRRGARGGRPGARGGRGREGGGRGALPPARRRSGRAGRGRRQDRPSRRADRGAAGRHRRAAPGDAGLAVHRTRVHRRLGSCSRRRRARPRPGAGDRAGPVRAGVRGRPRDSSPWEEGRLDAAEAHSEEVLESAQLSGNVQVAFWAVIGSSWIALARGDVDAALAHGQQGWELLGDAAVLAGGLHRRRRAAGGGRSARRCGGARGVRVGAPAAVDARPGPGGGGRRPRPARARPRRGGGDVGQAGAGRGRRSPHRRLRRHHRARRRRRPARPGRAGGGRAGRAGRRRRRRRAGAGCGARAAASVAGEALLAERPPRRRAPRAARGRRPAGERAGRGDIATPRCGCCVASATARGRRPR